MDQALSGSRKHPDDTGDTEVANPARMIALSVTGSGSSLDRRADESLSSSVQSGLRRIKSESSRITPKFSRGSSHYHTADAGDREGLLHQREASEMRVDKLLFGEMQSKTSATQHYLYQDRKVQLARLLFIAASYHIFMISSLLFYNYIIDKDCRLALNLNTTRRWFKTMLLLGTALGAITFGPLFDQHGWHFTLVVALSVTLIGNIISLIFILLFLQMLDSGSLSAELLGNGYIVLISLSGFFVGTGVGGMYTTSGILSTSLSSVSDPQWQIVSTFVMQVVGNALAVVASLVVLSSVMIGRTQGTLKDNLHHDFLIIVLGVVLIGYCLFHAFSMRMRFQGLINIFDITGHQAKIRSARLKWKTLFGNIFRYPKDLVGSSITWFFFNFFYYGNRTFNKVVRLGVTAGTGHAANSIYLNQAALLIGIELAFPAYLLSFTWASISDTLPWRSCDRKWVQVTGFLLVCILYLISGVLSFFQKNECNTYAVGNVTKSVAPGSCLTNTTVATAEACYEKFQGVMPGFQAAQRTGNADVWSNCICVDWDPAFSGIIICAILRYIVISASINPSTFVIAADSAPRATPGTFFGVCAACGKLGAFVGYLVYSDIFYDPDCDDDYHKNTVVKFSLDEFLGAAMCFLAMVISIIFITQKEVCCWGCCNGCWGCNDVTMSSRRLRLQRRSKLKRSSDKERPRTFSSVDLLGHLSTRDYYIRFSEIQIGKRIAAGGHGRVYMGTFGGQDVCCKELFTTVSDNEDLAEFENEARLMLKISHPNIVRLFGFSTRPMPELPDRTSFYLVSEFCHGGSIRGVLEYYDSGAREPFRTSEKSVSLTPEMLFRWSIDICKAMAFLHRRDQPIAHLDLKPGNILLDSPDLSRASIKICDLGTARALRNNDDFIEIMEQKKIGTPAYMPPEMVSVYNTNAHVIATKVDVYEAGVTFGYMWSGIPPWHNENFKFSSELELLYERIARGERPSLQGGPRRIPLPMVRVLDGMLSHIPEDRPSFEEVAPMIQQHLQRASGNRKPSESKSTKSKMSEISQVESLSGKLFAGDESVGNIFRAKKSFRTL